jgi:hypothetical protein
MKIGSTVTVLAAASVTAWLTHGCSDGTSSHTSGTDAGADADLYALGQELKVDVPASGRVFVHLGWPPAMVAVDGDPKTSRAWDLAFEGLDVYTNSGASGSGPGSAFGPLDTIVFLDDAAPQVPFLVTDKTGGAFIRWYFYEGEPSHALLSRFHVYGVKDGDRLFKVQLLNYYGVRDNAPISALYGLRYAEILEAGPGPTTEIADLDGTLGGPTAKPDGPGECLDLGTGARTKLTADEARGSSAWHICARRDDISVNGEQGGPRGVGAIDLDADATATETGAAVRSRTPESEKARFDAVNAATLAGRTFRGDRIVSAFTDLWIERGSKPPAPRKAVWLVNAVDGQSKFLVGAARFEGATLATPGSVILKVKQVK